MEGERPAKFYSTFSVWLHTHTLGTYYGPDYAITITQLLGQERSGFQSHLYHFPEVRL